MMCSGPFRGAQVWLFTPSGAGHTELARCPSGAWESRTPQPATPTGRRRDNLKESLRIGPPLPRRPAVVPPEPSDVPWTPLVQRLPILRDTTGGGAGRSDAPFKGQHHGRILHGCAQRTSQSSRVSMRVLGS